MEIVLFPYKLLKIMGLKKEEKNKLFWSLMLVFFSGALLCYISSLPLALFLNHYGSKNMPQIYLIASCLSILMGFIYMFLEYRLSFNKIIIGTGFSIILGIIVLGMALIPMQRGWIIFALLVWTLMAYEMIEFSIWAVINRIYTIHQAKKAFGIISGCQSIGGLIAGLSSPLLIAQFGLNNLVAGTGLIGLFIVFCMIKLLKRNTKSHIDTHEENTPYKPQLKVLISDKFILKIVGLSVLLIFAFFIIDLAFNTAAETHFSTKEKLASFLGVFWGLIDGVDLIFSVIFFNWILKHCGVIFTLFILPVTGILLSLPIIIAFHVPFFASIFFGSIIALKLCEESLRTSLSEMGNLILLQVFPLELRSFIQAKLDSIIIGLSSALIGIILIVITRIMGTSIELLIYMELFCFFGSVFILMGLKPQYIQAIKNAITSRTFERGKSILFSKEHLEVLEKSLSSAYPDEVIYALKAIEEIDRKEFAQNLSTAFSSKNFYIKRFAIEKIKHHKLIKYYPILIDFINRPQEKALQVLALECASALDYENIKNHVYKFMETDFLSLKKAALAIVIRMDEDQSMQEKALDEVTKMAANDNISQRMAAASILSKSPEKLKKLLPKLCNDKENKVKDIAFLAALKIKEYALYDVIVKNILHFTLYPKAIMQFKKNINQLQPIIERHFGELTTEEKVKIITILGQIQNAISLKFLECCALLENLAVRHSALKALTHFEQSYTPSFIEDLEKQIFTEISTLQQQHDSFFVIPKHEVTQLLLRILQREKNNTVERVLLALSLIFDKPAMRKIQKALKSSNEDNISYGIELLDTLLYYKYKVVLTPLLMHIFLGEHRHPTKMGSEDFHRIIKQGLNYNESNLKDSIATVKCLACIYIVFKLNIEECFNELNHLKQLDDPLIQETFSWLSRE